MAALDPKPVVPICHYELPLLTEATDRADLSGRSAVRLIPVVPGAQSLSLDLPSLKVWQR